MRRYGAKEREVMGVMGEPELQWPEPTNYMIFPGTTDKGEAALALLKAARDNTVPESEREKRIALMFLLDVLVDEVLDQCGSVQQNLRRLFAPTKNLLALDQTLEKLKMDAAETSTEQLNIIGAHFMVSTVDDVPGLGKISGLPLGGDEPIPLDDKEGDS